MEVRQSSSLYIIENFFLQLTSDQIDGRVLIEKNGLNFIFFYGLILCL